MKRGLQPLAHCTVLTAAPTVMATSHHWAAAAAWGAWHQVVPRPSQVNRAVFARGRSSCFSGFWKHGDASSPSSSWPAGDAGWANGIVMIRRGVVWMPGTLRQLLKRHRCGLGSSAANWSCRLALLENFHPPNVRNCCAAAPPLFSRVRPRRIIVVRDRGQHGTECSGRLRLTPD